MSGKCCLLPVLLYFYLQTASAQQSLNGAWQRSSGGQLEMLLFADGYFTRTAFDTATKHFGYTMGGVIKPAAKQLSLKIEFDSENSSQIGIEKQLNYQLKQDTLWLDEHQSNHPFVKLNIAKDDLNGLWRIASRLDAGTMKPMAKTDRKTLKLLIGGRFHWFAINPATKEFFGTGGGTYTFSEGKYVERIEFFSRDSSRVGALLVFDGKVINDRWEHSGQSSSGKEIWEIWAREEN